MGLLCRATPQSRICMMLGMSTLNVEVNSSLGGPPVQDGNFHFYHHHRDLPSMRFPVVQLSELTWK